MLGEFRGFPVIKDRICKRCNNKIGKEEEQFCRSGPESFFRELLGIEGSPKHTKINPFERGSGGGKPIDVIEPDPNTGIPILWEPNLKESSSREIRQVILMDENGKFHHIRIRTWMRDSQQLRQEIDKLGLGKIRDILFYASEEDMAWVESLVKGLGMGGEPEWLATSQPAIIKNPKAKFSVIHVYFRAVAKIGFHYFLSVVPDVRGSESSFSALRDFIISGGDPNQFVLEERTSIIKPGYRPKRYGHVICAQWQNGDIQARAQFFFGPNYIPPVYRIKIAEGLDSLKGTGSKGHFFAYFSDGKVGRYHGEVSELTPMVEEKQSIS